MSVVNNFSVNKVFCNLNNLKIFNTNIFRAIIFAVFCLILYSSESDKECFFLFRKSCYDTAMSAYIEYVILDNFCITFSLGYLTNKLALRRVSVLRCLLASFVGTAVAVCYPFIKGDGWLLATKFVLWLVLCALLFLGRRRFMFCSLIFLLLTFVFGGCVLAVAMVSGDNIQSVMRINLSEFPIGVLLGCCLVCVIVLRGVIVKFCAKRDISKVVYDFKLKLFGKELLCKGLMDTGNRLYDHKNRLPVVVFSAKALVDFLSEEQFTALFSGNGESLQKGARYMQIETIAGGMNKILLVKPDEFILYSERRKNILCDVMIGIAFTPMGGADDFDAILHPSLM